MSRTTTGQMGEMSGQGDAPETRLRRMNSSVAHWNISRKNDMSMVWLNPIWRNPIRTPPGIAPGYCA